MVAMTACSITIRKCACSQLEELYSTRASTIVRTVGLKNQLTNQPADVSRIVKTFQVYLDCVLVQYGVVGEGASWLCIYTDYITVTVAYLQDETGLKYLDPEISRIGIPACFTVFKSRNFRNMLYKQLTINVYRNTKNVYRILFISSTIVFKTHHI